MLPMERCIGIFRLLLEENRRVFMYFVAFCTAHILLCMQFCISIHSKYLTSHPHVGASGHTVSLLAVTVVLVLECSTGGEGN